MYGVPTSLKCVHTDGPRTAGAAIVTPAGDPQQPGQPVHRSGDVWSAKTHAAVINTEHPIPLDCCILAAFPDSLQAS